MLLLKIYILLSINVMKNEDNKKGRNGNGNYEPRKEKTEMVDLTTTSRHFFNAVVLNEKWKKGNRVVRRKKEQKQILHDEGGNSMAIEQTQLTYITGVKYFFQIFIRQYSVVTLIVWAFLFLAEAAMVVLYIWESFMEGVGDSWRNYDRTEWSYFFWCRVTLSVVLCSQLFFAYSVSIPTISIVILTTIYQLVICLVALISKNGSITRMYIPFFLRCWPMRQYFLFVLDSIALMTPRRRELDLFRLASEPLTLFICLLFTTACFFHLDQSFRGYPVNIGVALYFVVVTVSTVGFGDVVPHTAEGKAIVIIAVFVFLAQMPLFIQAILSTISIYKSYRSYDGPPGHFMVYGHLTAADVVSILDETFSLYPSTPIVFCNSEFSDDVLALSSNPAYQSRSTFLTIDALNAPSLERIKASSSSGLVIFPLDVSHSPRVDDDVMLAARIMKRRVPSVPQYLWLRYGLHASLVRKQSVVRENYIKKAILSTALLLPGIIPFLVNLIRGAWTGGTDPQDLWERKGIWDWKNQYRYSRRQRIGCFSCPDAFIGMCLRDVILCHRAKDILVIGIHRPYSPFHDVFPDLEYRICILDRLVLIYDPSSHKSFQHNSSALQELWAEEFHRGRVREDFLSVEKDDAEENGGGSGEVYNSFCFSEKSFHEENEGNEKMKEKNPRGKKSATAPRLLPSFCENIPIPNSLTNEIIERGDNYSESGANGEDAKYLDADRLKECLCSLQFTVKKPLGVPLEEIQLSAHAVQCLNDLLRRHSDAIIDPYCPHLDRERLENMINNILVHVVYTSQDVDNGMPNLSVKDTFIFVDLPSSALGQSTSSVYEEIISHVIARYELFTMMRRINAIHKESTAVHLTMRKYQKAFIHNWAKAFGSPLRYIRGQTSVAAHLSYAFTTASDPAYVHGILLYSSYMGVKKYGDVPIYIVDKALREIIDVCEKIHSIPGESPERNIIVELECFTSCIQLSPFHTDPEWIVRAKENFQDTLSFMSGRCFSANMLITLPFYAHKDSAILEFLNMVLPPSPADEVFDESKWSNSVNHPEVLFHHFRDTRGLFSTFGSAFNYLLKQKSFIAIGIFRLFPQKERLPQSSRYFVTNPSQKAPLVVDDIIYCLDAQRSTR